MAVVTTKSTAVTNADSTTQTLNKNTTSGGRKRESIGIVEAANGDSSTSQYRFCRVYSSWRVAAVLLYCDAITSGAMDVGIYQTAANGGAVVDADFFASAQSIASALVVGTNIAHESGVYGIEDLEKPLWEALGLTADPGRWYDVVGTLTADTAAAGTIVVAVEHLNGD